MKPKTKSCVFCGKPTSPGDLSREHILPRWLVKSLGIKQDLVQGVHCGNPWGAPLISERVQSFGSMVLGRVCKKCNTGWMSRLENSAKPILLGLMSATQQTASLDDRSANVIARWAYKTAAILNLGTNYRQIIPHKHLREFHDTKNPPATCAIDLALGPVDSEHLWQQGPFAVLEYDGEVYSPQALAEQLASLYTVALNVNGVLLRLVGSPVASWKVLLPETFDAVRLWPLERLARPVTVRRGTADVGELYFSTRIRVE